MVRGTVSFALGQFAEHLQPEILSHYQSVLTCILNALEDPSDGVKAILQQKSYYAPAAFCEKIWVKISYHISGTFDMQISYVFAEQSSEPARYMHVCNWLCSSCCRTCFYPISRDGS